MNIGIIQINNDIFPSQTVNGDFSFYLVFQFSFCFFFRKIQIILSHPNFQNIKCMDGDDKHLQNKIDGSIYYNKYISNNLFFSVYTFLIFII